MVLKHSSKVHEATPLKPSIGISCSAASLLLEPLPTRRKTATVTIMAKERVVATLANVLVPLLCKVSAHAV